MRWRYVLLVVLIPLAIILWMVAYEAPTARPNVDPGDTNFYPDRAVE